MMFRIFKNRIYIGLSLFVLLVALYFVLYPWCVVEYTKSKGDEIILKIEKYKKEHMGLYPLSLRQLGLEQTGTDCSYSYKGRTFYYDCFQDIGGEYSISFYNSGKHYSYESLTKSWAEGERVEEINNLRHKMYKIIMSPANQKMISEKWICDSVYYSIEDSQNVANVRLYYKNGHIAARGKVLQKFPSTKVGDWIFYTQENDGLNVRYGTDKNGKVLTRILMPSCNPKSVIDWFDW